VSLTVLSVAYPFAPAGANAVGGAEQVLGQVDAALVGSGHRSLVMASSNSQVLGTLLAVEEPLRVITEEQRRAAWALRRARLEQALRDFDVDVVHMHAMDFLAYLPPPGKVPVLVSLHLPPAWYPHEVFESRRGDVHLHCVSRAQQRQCPPGARLLPAIENGVHIPPPVPHVRRRGFALALGRICAEKNWHAALDASRIAGVPLLLAGQVFPYEAHEHYFETQLRPRMDRLRRFIGPVGRRRKLKLLSMARCLLVPSLAPETSSLVAMEALACGTPVIAYPSGALPDIVEEGVTGFLVRSPEEMAAAIHRCNRIDPERCRAAARERFNAQHMTARYLDVYHQLAAHAVDCA
jgi:glycosyltransferase involved in cell wall biosynthesis